MNGVPGWVPIVALVVSIISIAITIWSLTKSPSARNSSEQLRVLQEKLRHEQTLELVVAMRHYPADPDIVEMMVYNVNSAVIYITAAVKDGITLNMDERTSNRINPSLKSAEGTPILQFSNPAKALDKGYVYLSLHKALSLELHVFLASDPNHMHIQPVNFNPVHAETIPAHRITMEQYADLVKKLSPI